MVATNESAPRPRYFLGYFRLHGSEDSTPEAQEKELRDWYDAKLLGRCVQFAGIAGDDDGTYKKPFRDRPIGQQILRLLRPGDYLVTRASRAFCGPRDLVRTCRDLMEREVKVVLLDMPWLNRFTLDIFEFWSKSKAQERAERAFEARQMAMERKRLFGPRPWGQRWIAGRKGEKFLVPFRLELFLISTAAKLCNAGLSQEATSERIRRLVCQIEGKKYRQDKPISVWGRRWSINAVREAVRQYDADEELRALADKYADFWPPIRQRPSGAA